MRALSLATVALCVTLSFSLAAEVPNRSADEAAIHQIWQKFEAAFNRGDSKTAASVFAVDGDRMDSLGQFFQGRAAIERSYVDLFQAPIRVGPPAPRSARSATLRLMSCWLKSTVK